ncbi:hypothetical protein [Heyndrickxia ginsengihumi]|nr:hypothetical protein [Heyndrickxia ginsengihumi]
MKKGWDKSILTKENPNIALQSRSGNILCFPRTTGEPPDLFNIRL